MYSLIDGLILYVSSHTRIGGMHDPRASCRYIAMRLHRRNLLSLGGRKLSSDAARGAGSLLAGVREHYITPEFYI